MLALVVVPFVTRGAALMRIVNGWPREAIPVPSATTTVNVASCALDGVPEITPVDASNRKPAGRLPLAIVQFSGPREMAAFLADSGLRRLGGRPSDRSRPFLGSAAFSRLPALTNPHEA